MSDAGVSFVFRACVCGTLDAVVCAGAGAPDSAVEIASAAVVFYFFLSLTAVGLRSMIDIAAVDSQREEEKVQRSSYYR